MTPDPYEPPKVVIVTYFDEALPRWKRFMYGYMLWAPIIAAFSLGQAMHRVTMHHEVPVLGDIVVQSINLGLLYFCRPGGMVNRFYHKTLYGKEP